MLEECYLWIVKRLRFPTLNYLEEGTLHLEISSFVYFIVEIISHGSNSIHITMSFKILNDATICAPLDL